MTDTDCGYVYCTPGGPCINSIVDCPNDASDCTVVCAVGSCMGSTINCLDGHACVVQTGGLESAQSAKINGNGATSLVVHSGAVGDKLGEAVGD